MNHVGPFGAGAVSDEASVFSSLIVIEAFVTDQVCCW
jgi:hypothetical protein